MLMQGVNASRSHCDWICRTTSEGSLSHSRSVDPCAAVSHPLINLQHLIKPVQLSRQLQIVRFLPVVTVLRPYTILVRAVFPRVNFLSVWLIPCCICFRFINRSAQPPPVTTKDLLPPACPSQHSYDAPFSCRLQ